MSLLFLSLDSLSRDRTERSKCDDFFSKSSKRQNFFDKKQFHTAVFFLIRLFPSQLLLYLLATILAIIMKQ